MTDVLADVSELVRCFGSFTAVNRVSLQVRPGEIVGLLGANGAGKTTVIRSILGLEAPDGGLVRVFGRPPSRSTRAQLGYMPQGLGLYRELSVQENAEFAAQAFGLRGAPALPPALAALAHRPVGSISLGYQRRLAFTLALQHSPRLLILDEPTSGVDPLTRARLWDTIHDQAAAGAGVLVTTHYLQEAEQCSRLELMDRGRVVASGQVSGIVAGRQAQVVRCERWQEAFGALDAAGLPVTLAGRTVRVAGASAGTVRAALRGLDAEVATEPATLEEVMVLIARQAPGAPLAGPGAE